MKTILLTFTLAAAALLAQDATGTWQGTLTVPTSDGGTRPGPALVILKQEGAKVTGTAGPDEDRRHPIDNGKAEGGRITFEIGGEGMKFDMKQDGDKLAGDVTREREGEVQKATISLERKKPQ